VTDDERMAEIGRAVVEHYMPDNPRGAREATPERVLERIRRDEEARRSLEDSDALRIGRLALTCACVLRDALKPVQR
jgi:hypothetical protein